MKSYFFINELSETGNRTHQNYRNNNKYKDLEKLGVKASNIRIKYTEKIHEI